MIDRKSYIIKNNRRRYKATCSNCNGDRGYKIPSEADKLCTRCNCIKASQASITSRGGVPKTDKLCLLPNCSASLHLKLYCRTHYKEFVLSIEKRDKNGLYVIECKHCNSVFSSKNRRLYCDQKCNNKAHLKRHPEREKARAKKYREANIEKIKDCSKEWRLKNKQKIKEYQSIPNNRIANNIRSRISRAVKRGLKCGSAIDSLGCSIEQLKLHLQSNFVNGMTWDNYGEWHIDHIVPLISFDLSNLEHFKVACHYTNLQPLWAKDNISKGGR